MPSLNRQPTKRNVDLDQLFSVLSHPYRRRILTALASDGPRQQGDFSIDALRTSNADRETSRIELHHAHLPQLDDAGFVDWDRRTGRVTRGETFEEIQPLLELLDDHSEEFPGEWP